jgi:hypothetical protein
MFSVFAEAHLASTILNKNPGNRQRVARAMLWQPTTIVPVTEIFEGRESMIHSLSLANQAVPV